MMNISVQNMLYIVLVALFALFTPSRQTCPSLQDKPLILTPYITENKIDEAQNLSFIPDLPGNVTGYSGFLTVNKTYDSNLYFVYFPVTQGNPTESPTLLWLQGGPGASSLFGLFEEIGPITVSSKLKLKRTLYHWTSFHNVLYIDNPAGAGFSYTCQDQGYARGQEDVARDLYEALTQFFKLFPNVKQTPFYVTGESYAGKYVPAITRQIHLENPTAEVKINLKGMAIGNGLSDPETMLDQSDFLYSIGLFDNQARQIYHEAMVKVTELIHQEKWLEAFNAWDPYLNGDIFPYQTFFTNVTGYTNYFNYLHPQSYIKEYYSDYLKTDQARSQFHFGNLNMSSGRTVEMHLLEDMTKSVKPWVQEILDAGYQVLYYSGSLDIIVATPTTDRFLQTLQWKHAAQFNNATRNIFRLKKKVVGYWKKVENLCFVIVRNSGHMVPHDQPTVALDMITRFTRNKSF